MAIKISELTAVTSIAGTEEIPVVQSATTKKATASQLKGYRSCVGLLTWNAIDEELNFEVLQNDAFTISATKTNDGIYNLEDTSAPFLDGKTALFIGQTNNNEQPVYDIILYTFYRSDNSNLVVRVKDLDLAGGNVYSTDAITRVSLEIRVYP